jgi:hypothetical protein
MASVNRNRNKKNEENQGCEVNEKTVWERDVIPEPFRKSASIKISNDDAAMTLCVSGMCCTMPIEKWHEAAMIICCDPA